MPSSVDFSGLTSFALPRGKIVASVAANALTVALKNADGTDPSTTSPLQVSFRSAVGSGAAYEGRALTTALSVSLPSGATAGFVASDPSRLWVVLFDAGDGTVKLALINCVRKATLLLHVYPLVEFSPASTVLNNTSADNAGVFYADTALTSKPYRIIGYLDWNSGLGTPGTWSAGPDVIQMMGPGVARPGDIVQQFTSLETSQVSFLIGGGGGQPSVLPIDGTAPQTGETAIIFTNAITPQSPVNIIENEALVNLSATPLSAIGLALFQDAGSSAISATYLNNVPADEQRQLSLAHLKRAATSSSMSFVLRVGMSVAGAIGITGTQSLGDTIFSRFITRERMG